MKKFMNKKILGFCVILLTLGCIVFYLLIPLQSSQVKAAYEAYAEVAKQHDDAAYFPGTVDNPLRYELNQVLSEVLVGDITSERRLALAKEGLQKLNELESQIDTMGALVPSVESAIEYLEKTAGPLQGHQTSSDVASVVALARERLNIIADIRGLSYRANFHTEEIFKRVIDNNGSLTADHVSFLNNQIPLVEEQFDERSNLYTELQSVGFEIERLSAHFE